MMLPPDTTLPFFAYGFLRPGELAYHQIQEFVSTPPVEAVVRGRLWLRDGLLLLELDQRARPSDGCMLRFRPDGARSAYAAIADLEPAGMYEWHTAEVDTKQGPVRANLLVGVDLPGPDADKPESLAHATSANDPLFNEALAEIRRIAEEGDCLPDRRMGNAMDLAPFFRQQMAYLLLWSSIERYASLRYRLGGRDYTERVLRLAEESAFAEALKVYVRGRKDTLYNADRHGKPAELNPSNPEASLRYYYRVRGNIVHRGKAAIRDREVISCSLRELLDIFEHVLRATLPSGSVGRPPCSPSQD